MRRQATTAGTVLLAVTGLALTAAACSSSSGPSAGSPGKPITITYWTSSSQAEINWLDSHFNATHSSIKVQGQYIASADDTTAKEVAALKTNTEPNVIIGQDPSALPLLAESGKVVSLNGPLASETSGLYPGIKSALFYKGRQLGMALGGVGDYVLFYNKTDFAKAGISSPPATWTQLEADAIKLSDPAKHHYGFYVPWGTAEWISYEWEGLLWANGGQILNSSGAKTAFDSPAGVAALTTWVDLVRKDHAAPTTSFAEAGSDDGAPAFASDAVSMIIDGQWAVSEFNTAKLRYGVALVPAGTSGHSAANIGIGVATVFTQGGTAAQNAAIQFVQWLAQPAQGAYLTAENGGLPSAPDQLQQAAVKQEAASQPTYQTFATQLQTGQTRPTVPAYTQISLALATEIQDALKGTVTPAQALATAAADGNQAIASGGSGS
ncbi:MAG TPA: extracellular solute-binding protein [Streptosporangiaceae bacterium]|jgi:multiple sugar transport system substrate-binding protein|nr:extracellular solute-binding protein [Streptosporangiaceae bacterium]